MGLLCKVYIFLKIQGDKLRWWPIYHEPEHELVGRIQLYINYSCQDESNQNKVHAKSNCLASLQTYLLWMYFGNFLFLFE